MIDKGDSILRGGYEDLAAEYYDPKRHPTSANFREASAQVLSDWLESIDFDSSRICEVGAGKSLCAELLTGRIVLDSLVLLDSSPSMLAYSKAWCAAGAQCIVASGEALPLETESAQILVSVLGDAYNTPAFWSEVVRVLKRGGRAFFTTPSHQWAMLFRSTRADCQESAEFELSTGQVVLVPSFIYNREDQVGLIMTSGLTVDDVADRPLSCLRCSPISPKLLPERGPKAPIISAYFVHKGT